MNLKAQTLGALPPGTRAPGPCATERDGSFDENMRSGKTNPSKEGRPVNRLSQLFSNDIAFGYGCLDRVVIRGYYPALQREENIVHFFRDVVGAPVVDSRALASRTARYRRWVEEYVRDHHIERLPAPKGVKNEDFVVPYYQQLGRQEGIACLLTSMEQGTTFASYEPRFPTENERYRILKRCRRLFQHFYFYVFDPIMGPMSLRVSTYLPFSIQVWLNGHSFVAEHLTRQGIGFEKYDNAILGVDDMGSPMPQPRRSPRS